MPHLADVAYWRLEELLSWAGSALDAIREIRRGFTGPGNVEWRVRAADKLEAVRADGPGLLAWLSAQPADAGLRPIR